MLIPGQIVFSKQGRDKGRLYVCIKTESNYAYLADGKLRKLNNPKKKKFMHIQKTKNYLPELNAQITTGTVTDCDIKKALNMFMIKEDEPCQK